MNMEGEERKWRCRGDNPLEQLCCEKEQRCKEELEDHRQSREGAPFV